MNPTRQAPFTGPQIDLNADLGEGHPDAALLDLVSSASIACGFHAGDAAIMRATVRVAAQRGVAIGAHPGYHDLEGFGRRAMDVAPEMIAAETIYQLGALQACCSAEGARVRYVKPHGALYHRVSRDLEAATAMVEAIASVDPSLKILGLNDSALLRAAAHVGLGIAREGFLDRGVRPDGSLVPRGEPGDLLHDIEFITKRAVDFVHNRAIDAIDGTKVNVVVDSLCIHGDGDNAIELTRAVRNALEASGVTIAPFTGAD